MKFNPLDIIGREFGRLKVYNYIGKEGKSHKYRCVCSCGNEKITDRIALFSKHTQSCGCLFKSICWQNRVTHGATKGEVKSGKRVLPPEYVAWAAMKYRCLNPSSAAYHNYGGRGITICEQWVSSFETFLLDVGPRPSEHHSLDRIDNNKGYEPSNVRWATSSEQGNNTRSNILLNLNGISKSMSQWSRAFGISKHVVHTRLKSGWPLEEAMTTPTRVIKTNIRNGKPFNLKEQDEIRKMFDSGLSRSEIGRRLGVCTTTISRVISRTGAYDDSNPYFV